jgi:isoleucyl-tRNA synthetase
MKYPEYKAVNYAEVADQILEFWNTNDIFQKSIETREGNPTFTFFEGPPSANGTPGIHHVMARAIKDIFCRYKTLKGFQVHRKGGWDTHGLPVELQVEKELGITKEDIGKKVSVEEYNRKCRETVMRFTNEWNELTLKMGYWVDLEDPYITYENNYIESVWYLLSELYKKDLLYKGYSIQPYSPAAGTGLSSHELNQPGCYREVKDTSITAQFKLEKTEKSKFVFDEATAEVYVLAWTTTPWTLPANAALTVGKNIEYALVNTFNPYTFLPVNVILAKDLIGKYFTEKTKDGDFDGFASSDKKNIPWTILTTFKGNKLEDLTYQQLMPYVQPETPAFRIIIGDFVTTEDGTGVVHTAPTFGADDFRVAQQNNIPPIMVKDETGKDVPIVNRQGKFVAEITDYALEFVKEAYLSDAEKDIEKTKQGRDKYLSVDERIAIKLKTENRAFNVQRFDHPYPHCWRTDKPVLYYPLDSWFIKTTAVKDKLVALNKTINWKPESTGTGRFGNWLENLVDWNLSRSRYWGTPLPIWKNESGEEICIGSIEELSNEIDKAIVAGLMAENYLKKNGSEKDSFDLHRPYVDNIILVSKTGKPLTRETDLIDVWFDSGAMPYAQWHYPFENKEKIDNAAKNGAYPADFISEGVDQTRGWFFTLHAIAGMVFDSVAFKNVVSTGLVLDKNGNKMSKRLGNAVDPFETLKTYGADPTRWYMITNAQPWDNLKFDLNGITEVRNKFFGTLTNTYNFFALYGNLDGFESSGKINIETATELDKWILSKLETLKKEVDEAYETYEPTKAGRAIQDFVCDHLSNWYIRLSRRRFWNPNATEAELKDKNLAYETLAYCLKNVAQLMSPIAPFYADWLYRNMTNNETTNSVHLSDFPTVNKSWINEDLENAMELAQKISSMIHGIRKTNRIKVRQPLSKILIPVLNQKTREQITRVDELIKTEVNVKSIEYIDDASGVLSKKVKPNFKALGPKFGKDMKAVADAIVNLTTDQLKEIELKGAIKLPIGQIELTDLEISTEDLPGYLTAQDGPLTVALDITIDAPLKAEGIARDFVNRIQNYRKDTGFDVIDKITITLENNNDELCHAIELFKNYISQEVQATNLEIVNNIKDSIEIEMDEYLLKLKINVVS